MTAARLPTDEENRLLALYELEIMDTIEEQAYDDLTKLASTICQTPIALVCLVGRNRQWFKSHYGLDARETPREHAFCAHAILGDDVMVVGDATKDERFFDNPLVTGEPNIRFYAGAPLITSKNKRVGTLCVISDKPQSISSAAKDALKALARQVVCQFELRLKIKELRIIKNKAEQENQLKSEFLSSISCQLRVPLNAILGFAQLIKMDDDDLTECHKESVDYIIKGGHQLLTLANETLDLAKIAPIKLTMDNEIISIQHIVSQSVELVKNMAHQSNIQINHETARNYKVHADSMRLKQVLINYLSNAIKYNRPNGTVTINYQPLENNRLRVNIIDCGYGLNETQISKLFKPSGFMAQKSSRANETGLSLKISKELIELMHGTVGVSSVIDKGSNFWFELDQG